MDYGATSSRGGGGSSSSSGTKTVKEDHHGFVAGAAASSGIGSVNDDVEMNRGGGGRDESAAAGADSTTKTKPSVEINGNSKPPQQQHRHTFSIDESGIGNNNSAGSGRHANGNDLNTEEDAGGDRRRLTNVNVVKKRNAGAGCWGGGCCFGNGVGKSSCSDWQQDGLKLTILCMFVFAIGVTVALVIDIALELSSQKTGIHGSMHANRVVADNANCSALGRSVMEKGEGGNAVDAAVVAAFCSALFEPHIAGMGGGGVMLLHQHRTNHSVVINFRERVPASARNDRFIQNPNQAALGRTSVGVPGFVKGLHLAHSKYGSGERGSRCCSWTQLIYKVIRQAVQQGVPITNSLRTAAKTKIDAAKLKYKEAQHLKHFVSEMNGGNRKGQLLNDNAMFQAMIKSLEAVALDGPEAIYGEKGRLAQEIVEATGGLITLDDLKNYEAVEEKPLKIHLGDFMVMSAAAPTAGPKLLAFLNAMDLFFGRNDHQSVSPFGSQSGSQSVRLSGSQSGDGAEYLAVEAEALASLQALQLGLGDPKGNPTVDKRTQWMVNKVNIHSYLSSDVFDKSDFASAYTMGGEPVGSNVAAMDKQDNYVTFVTSLNTWFGSNIMTKGGLVLNNALSNFFTPSAENSPSPTANRLTQGHRPLTPNVVSLAMDSRDICGSRFLFGGASADAVGQVMVQPLLDHVDIKAAVDAARLLYRNDTLFLEGAIDKGRDDVRKVQEEYEGRSAFLTLPYAAVNALKKTLDKVLAYPDARSHLAPQ